MPHIPHSTTQETKLLGHIEVNARNAATLGGRCRHRSTADEVEQREGLTWDRQGFFSCTTGKEKEKWRRGMVEGGRAIGANRGGLGVVAGADTQLPIAGGARMVEMEHRTPLCTAQKEEGSLEGAALLVAGGTNRCTTRWPQLERDLIQIHEKAPTA